MATPQVETQRILDVQLKALEMLRKWRRDRAEEAVMQAGEILSQAEKNTASHQADLTKCTTELGEWNREFSEKPRSATPEPANQLAQAGHDHRKLIYAKRVTEMRLHRAMSEQTAAEEALDTAKTLAKASAASHEKVIECRKPA
jgi:hypothetical protein